MVDVALRRFRLPELVVGKTKSAGDPLTATGSVQLLGLSPLLSVVVSLFFRIREGVSATIPTASAWTVSAIARSDGSRTPVALNVNPLVVLNTLPDGFETASAVLGLQFDVQLNANGTSDLGEWVMVAEACPVDAELVFKCPELLHALYGDLKLVPLQGVLILNDPTG